MKTLLAFVIAALVLPCLSPTLAAGLPFFPMNTFGGDQRDQDFKEAWYSKHLRVMNETPLWPLATDTTKQLYRFTCLRTFDEPFCITLTVHSDGRGTLIRKLTSGKGGYEPGTLKETQKRLLTKSQIEEFLKLLKSERYWQLEADLPPEGLDGSQWIIEAAAAGRYHIVDRWTPDASTEIGKIGRALLELAGWKIKNLY